MFVKQVNVLQSEIMYKSLPKLVIHYFFFFYHIYLSMHNLKISHKNLIHGYSLTIKCTTTIIIIITIKMHKSLPR